MRKQAMAQQYTEITLPEFEKLLMAGFRSLRPKKGASMGEVTYDLHLSSTTGIRIRTSIPTEGAATRGVGADIIQLSLYSFRKNTPLISRDMILKVKRTQGWRDGVRDRIETLMEMYDSKEEDIERGAYIKWGSASDGDSGIEVRGTD